MKLENIYQKTKNFKVLFAEDDTNFREETKEVFEYLFSKVTIAKDGKEAFELYEQYHRDTNNYFDIVISDINMPFINGIELTKKIYSINKSQVVIILSAHNETQYLMDLINLGIEQFLLKPIQTDQLFNILNKTADKLLQSSDDLNNNSSLVRITKEYSWDKETLTLLQNNKPIKLSNYEIYLIKLLIKNSPKISTHEEILNDVWKDKMFEVNNDVIKSTVHRIRQKTPGLIIENISKLGYRIVF